MRQNSHLTGLAPRRVSLYSLPSTLLRTEGHQGEGRAERSEGSRDVTSTTCGRPLLRGAPRAHAAPTLGCYKRSVPLRRDAAATVTQLPAAPWLSSGSSRRRRAMVRSHFLSDEETESAVISHLISSRLPLASLLRQY